MKLRELLVYLLAFAAVAATPTQSFGASVPTKGAVPRQAHFGFRALTAAGSPSPDAAIHVAGKSVFFNTAQGVGVDVFFADASRVPVTSQYKLSFAWYDPQNTRVQTQVLTRSMSDIDFSFVASRLLLRGGPLSKHLGRWRVRLTVNGAKAGSGTFVLAQTPAIEWRPGPFTYPQNCCTAKHLSGIDTLTDARSGYTAEVRGWTVLQDSPDALAHIFFRLTLAYRME